MSTNRTATRPLLALAAALVAAPLTAQEQVTVSGQPAFQQTVSFADLDLREKQARTVLVRRVMTAARAVCFAAEGRSAEVALGDSDGNCPNSTYRAARPQVAAAFRRAKIGEGPTATALVVAAPARVR